MKRWESLRGLHVLVTGAASGIGRQLALDLEKEGCSLLLLDRDLPGLEALRSELRAAPGAQTVSLHRCDVGSRAEVEAFAAEVRDRPLDVLINNAGLTHVGSFRKARLEDLERVIEVNLLGALRLTKAVLPQLSASGRGFIVNVASLAGLVGGPGLSAYTASKFGLVGLSEALAVELEGKVGVCAVCPSMVRTDIARRAPGGGAVDGLLRRLGSEPAKVSRAVIRAILHDERLVLVNLDAHLLHLLHRLSPFLSRVLVAAAYRRLLRSGVIEG